MSSETTQTSRRLRLLVALAVFIGAVVLIVATELGSRKAPPTQDSSRPAPAAAPVG